MRFDDELDDNEPGEDDLHAAAAPNGVRFQALHEEALRRVDSRERIEVAHYEREAEAELAAGMLRANGLAAEIGPMMIPGLNYQLTLWVRRADETLARDLLREADEGDFRDS